MKQNYKNLKIKLKYR